MNKVECFKIRVQVADNPFDIDSATVIKTIDIDIGNFLREPTTIVADPFLFVKDNVLYLFYENKKMYHKGVISMTKTVDLIHWSAPITVLEEQCHLSYPWVFEEDGHVYMIPETCGFNSIRLYEASDDLSSFKFVKTLLQDDNEYKKGFSFSDSSIYLKNDIYYLMTTVNDGKNNILKLYFADTLFGEYIEHPCSPVYVGNKYGRNAGCWFDYAGKLYRVAQDCVNGYGDNVHLIEIVKVTKDEYIEKNVQDELLPIVDGFYKNGGHQLNHVSFKGQLVLATDAKEYHYLLGNRIFHKMGVY